MFGKIFRYSETMSTKLKEANQIPAKKLDKYAYTYEKP
jgi:hypothetical protein